MHSDSSVKHKKWLLAVPDAAGYPHPLHALQRLYVHASIGMQLHIVLIQRTESVIMTTFRLNQIIIIIIGEITVKNKVGYGFMTVNEPDLEKQTGKGERTEER